MPQFVCKHSFKYFGVNCPFKFRKCHQAFPVSLPVCSHRCIFRIFRNVIIDWNVICQICVTLYRLKVDKQVLYVRYRSVLRSADLHQVLSIIIAIRTDPVRSTNRKKKYELACACVLVSLPAYPACFALLSSLTCLSKTHDMTSSLDKKAKTRRENKLFHCILISVLCGLTQQILLKPKWNTERNLAFRAFLSFVLYNV